MPSHLILLPCHSIYKLPSPPTEASSWHLAPFQIEANDHLTFLQHIAKAFEYHNSTPNSTLVISGGQTKREAGEVSESSSYLKAGEVLGLKGSDVIVEEYARDSFENLLFALCAFKDKHGCYPSKVTIVGFEFKRNRFVNCHAQALKLQDVEYIGIDPSPPYEEGTEEYNKYFQELNEAEWKFSVSLFKDDLLANGDRLNGKKLSRDPFNRGDGGYASKFLELKRFFTEGGVVDNTDDFEVPW